MEWINVNDDLPVKMTQKVDVYIKWEDHYKNMVGRRIPDCWYDGKVFCNSDGKGGWNKIENVSHWRKIPKPPEQ